ncbi:MAG: hypothetical protein HKN41_07355, partial [Ilumatobacter sp.]|nr:hypothetical protein [Ilumatobacter sp.]
HVRWLFVISLFVQIALVWAAVESGLVADLVGRVGNQHSRPVASWLVAVAIAGFVIANLPFQAHDLGPTADRAAGETLDEVFEQLDDFDPGGPIRYDVGNLRPFEAWSSAVQMRLRELGIEFRVDDEGVIRQLGDRRRVDGSEVTTIRQIERGAALVLPADACVISEGSPVDPLTEARVDALIAAAVDDLISGAVRVDAAGLGDDLPARFAAATAGDRATARVLVADGVVAFMAADGRLVESTPAVDAVVAEAALIDRRVVGTLVLVADPPVDCR